jgi:hypothetical protein
MIEITIKLGAIANKSIAASIVLREKTEQTERLEPIWESNFEDWVAVHHPHLVGMFAPESTDADVDVLTEIVEAHITQSERILLLQNRGDINLIESILERISPADRARMNASRQRSASLDGGVRTPADLLQAFLGAIEQQARPLYRVCLNRLSAQAIESENKLIVAPVDPAEHSRKEEAVLDLSSSGYLYGLRDDKTWLTKVNFKLMVEYGDLTAREQVEVINAVLAGWAIDENR